MGIQQAWSVPRSICPPLPLPPLFAVLSVLSVRNHDSLTGQSLATGMSQAMKESEAEVASELEESWAHLGQRRPIGSPEVVEERLRAGRSRTMGS